MKFIKINFGEKASKLYNVNDMKHIWWNKNYFEIVLFSGEIIRAEDNIWEHRSSMAFEDFLNDPDQVVYVVQI